MHIELDGVTLDVHDSGTGAAMVLLHGWPDIHNVWRHQVHALLAGGYRVIAPDLRGFGGSSRPTAVEAYTAPTMVGDRAGGADDDPQAGRTATARTGNRGTAMVVWSRAMVRCPAAVFGSSR